MLPGGFSTQDSHAKAKEGGTMALRPASRIVSALAGQLVLLASSGNFISVNGSPG
jgi:hypothetical protein